MCHSSNVKVPKLHLTGRSVVVKCRITINVELVDKHLTAKKEQSCA
jgi:hypothetical protein